ncbi:hypothetical protein M8C21_034015 [Ambrosia artemisiifolia]|uniref:TF-B3 domain-containing protein n=1 Tax=Ambrosia artemisiifolia TaxID=4212 RepID=A0AAD5GME5_AMBAR|nr:hypothetical protein M8C21_034015 [Ambrosia artemisiifolia]
MLLAQSSPRLPLSPDFVNKLLEDKIQQGPIMLTTKGGQSWRLEIKQIDDTYYFTNGWNNVVEDMQLRFGDFLSFRPLDQSTIKMSIFSPKDCDRFLAPKVITHDHGGNGKNEDGDPFFTSKINKNHIRSRVLRLPIEFARLAGIDGEGSMRVKNLDGKECVMGLKLDKSFRGKERYMLTSGWPQFLQENELSEGDECVFKFIRSEGKLQLAKVTKKQLKYGFS